MCLSSFNVPVLLVEQLHGSVFRLVDVRNLLGQRLEEDKLNGGDAEDAHLVLDQLPEEAHVRSDLWSAILRGRQTDTI